MKLASVNGVNVCDFVRGSRGSGINFRGTPVGTGSRPHGEFRYVVLIVWCLW